MVSFFYSLALSLILCGLSCHARALTCVDLFYRTAPVDIHAQGILGRNLSRLGWRLARAHGKAVPFEGRELAYFLNLTPDIFKNRPLDQMPTVRWRELEFFARQQMTAAEASEIVNYFRQSVLFDRLNGTAEANLLARFRQGYPTATGRSKGAFQFERNLQEGLSLLATFDLINGTDHALQAGFLLVRNFNLGPSRWRFGHWAFAELATIVAKSSSRRAVYDFFDAVVKAKTPFAFTGLAHAPHHVAQLLLKVNRGEAARPQPKQIEQVIKELMYQRLWMGLSPYTIEQPTALLQQGIKVGEIGAFYFDSAKPSDAHFVLSMRISQELEAGVQILKNEVQKISRNRSRTHGRALQGSSFNNPLFELQEALGVDWPIDLALEEPLSRGRFGP